MLLWYYADARNAGVPLAVASPRWVWLRRLDGPDIPQLPAISLLGPGVVRWQYDAEIYGDAVGQIEIGPDIADGYERYQNVSMTRENGRILSPQPGLISFTAG